MAAARTSTKVGKLRPSQAVMQQGPGSIVDLPTLSVVMAASTRWNKGGADRVSEPRLEAFLRVEALYRPPVPGPQKFGGLPAFVFPEFMVCPVCRRLDRKGRYSWLDRRGEYQCDAHNTPVVVFPARLIEACSRGHLDDFRWAEWAHKSRTDCDADLELKDLGFSGSINDLWVQCKKHKDARRSLGAAFGHDPLGDCSGRRPWLSPDHYDEAPCTSPPRAILRGASNAYFPVITSALSVPPWSDPIQMDVAPYREALKKVDSVEKLRLGVEHDLYDLGGLLSSYTLDEIAQALLAKPGEGDDLREREYSAFTHPEDSVEPGAEFKVARVAVNTSVQPFISDVVAGQRLREVRALRGFTRIDSAFDLGESTDVAVLDLRMSYPGTKGDNWLPAIELRGEGVFLKLNESRLVDWETSPPVRQRGDRFQKLYSEWLSDRVDRPLSELPSFPGMRYVLLHSLAHVLMRQMALDCGYSSSALRERIYSASEPPMSGLVIYTASADSEGSLGGLVDLAKPDRLAALVLEALEGSLFCSSDPLCGDRDAGTAGNLNAAACHACLLMPETCCEYGNRLLDRSVLVETVGQRDLSFFDPSYGR